MLGAISFKTHPMSTTENTRTDKRELKEVIKEFLNHLNFAYNYRLQKLIFYSEIWCIQEFGRRLTDAEFMPYDHGSFSRDIAEALNELREDEEVESESEFRNGNETFRYFHHPEGGELSPGKKEIIRKLHEETRSLSTEQLAQFSKQSWLFKNTEKGQPMDFEYYQEEVVIPYEERQRIAERAEEDTPAESREELREVLN